MHPTRYNYYGLGVCHQQWELEHQEVQDGQEGSVTGPQPTVLHFRPWNDDPDKFSV